MVLRFLQGRGPLLGPFVLWILLTVTFGFGLHLYGEDSLFVLSGSEHTFEALAWLRGRADLGQPPGGMVAEYRGLGFSSFPPTPTLLEVPWALLFGRASPHSFMLLLWLFVGVWTLFELGLRAGWSAFRAGIVAFCFVGGTNLLPAAVDGGSWAQGQIMGFVLACLALGFVTRNQGGKFGPWLGYLFLSLAVGCRTVYLLYFPLLVVLDARTSRPRNLPTVLKDAVIWGGPYLALLAIYNWTRFDHPLELGDSFLPRNKSLPHGLLSLAYLPENLFGALAKLPSLGNRRIPLQFDHGGNALWINCPVFIFSLVVGLLRPGDRLVFRAWALTLAAVWLVLLLIESAGNLQFGYRNVIDLLPLAFFGMLAASPEQDLRPAQWIPLALYSVGMNLYGIFWLSVERTRG